MKSSHILRNLHSMIRNSTLTYMNEFVWQDIELTNEFKKAYTTYLNKNRYDIDFLCSTAVITSSSSKYIYVPNQWFVIAAYVVDIYEELQLYKSYFKKIADKLNKPLDDYAKVLRDSASSSDKKEFMECAQSIFASFCSDESMVQESTTRLWRFANDYSWWSGQKTIGRGDFHLSVILNMLNLVNASQSYVGDIVSAYANNYPLKQLVKSIDAFTVNFDNGSLQPEENYILPDEEIRHSDMIEERQPEADTIPKPEFVRIIINETSTLKEIKYRG